MWSKFTCLVMKYHCYCYTISMFGQKSFTKLRSIGWDRRSCNNPQFTQLLLGVANLIFERLREWFEARYFLWIFFLSRRVHAWHFFLFHEKKVFFFGSRAWIFLGSGTVACIFFQNHSPLPQKSNDPCPQRQKFLSLSLWRSMEYANKPSEVLQWKIPRNSFLDNFLVSSRPWFFKIIQKDKEIEDLLNLK